MQAVRTPFPFFKRPPPTRPTTQSTHTTMTPKALTAHLIASLPKKRQTLIKGQPGVGKSDIVEQACAAIGADLIFSHPAVSDPTDYKGMPCVTKGGTEAH